MKSKILVFSKLEAICLALFVFFVSLLSVLLLSSCASIPSQFANASPALSTNDLNIIKADANIRQGLPAIEVAVSTGVPLLLNQMIKTPATLVRVGGFINIVATNVDNIVGSGTLPDASIITTTASKLNTTVNLSPSELATANSITQYAQSEVTGLEAQLNTLANSATDPSVKAYTIQTLLLAIQSVAKGTEDGTSQYAGVSMSQIIYKNPRFIVRGKLRAPHGERDPFHVLLARQ